MQHRVPGVKFISVLHVPSSRNGRLLKEIAKIELRLYKTSGYQVKLMEKSGKPLSNTSPKIIYHRSDCLPCSNERVKGPSACSVKNVVYESSCEICENEHL